MKTYVTFGQNHVHSINGKTFDKDCVAVIESESAARGRELAFQLLGVRFCFEYPEDRWNEEEQLKFFPRGYIELYREPLR